MPDEWSEPAITINGTLTVRDAYDEAMRACDDGRTDYARALLRGIKLAMGGRKSIPDATPFPMITLTAP